MKKTSVLLRESNKYKEVSYRDRESDQFQDEIIHKWQTIIDIGAKVLNADAGLIMKITEESMEVFLTSNSSNNPYPPDGKDSLGHGLYCETVIGNNEKLFIDDASSDEHWKDNPDIKLGMISYLGYPIRYPNGDFFGTICTLDRNKMDLSDEQFEFLKILRDSIEKDLILMEKLEEIKKLTNIDYLTGIYNRKFMDEKQQECQAIISRTNNNFLVTVLDLNDFKPVNDTYGHSTGDGILQAFAKIVKERLRAIDFFGRVGGDEFLILSMDTSVKEFTPVIEKLYKEFLDHEEIRKYGVSFAYGMSEANNQVTMQEAYTNADKLMYENKRMLKKANQEFE